jgi:hypothetical protein
MSKFFVIASLLLAACTSGAGAQGRDAGDRALGSELARDKAETRIDRRARISGRRKTAYSPARRSCCPKTPRASNSNSAEVRTASGTG